jgi:hypothetical protein
VTSFLVKERKEMTQAAMISKNAKAGDLELLDVA